MFLGKKGKKKYFQRITYTCRKYERLILANSLSFSDEWKFNMEAPFSPRQRQHMLGSFFGPNFGFFQTLTIRNDWGGQP
jgi:hypothetical protein